jgi:hypothetical protein
VWQMTWRICCWDNGQPLPFPPGLFGTGSVRTEPARRGRRPVASNRAGLKWPRGRSAGRRRGRRQRRPRLRPRPRRDRHRLVARGVPAGGRPTGGAANQCRGPRSTGLTAEPARAVAVDGAERITDDVDDGDGSCHGCRLLTSSSC